MALEDNIQDICVDKPRCGLCQFQFEDNDLVVAVLDDDRTSTPFCFRRNHTYEDKSAKIALHMCCQSRCIRSKRQVPCLHSGCRSITLIPISSNYLAATKYDFNPPIQFEFRRRNRIKWAVTKRLKQDFLPQMPQELCQMIAGYIIREIAAIALQERAKDVQPAISTIDLARDVYATYIDIEGILYLQSLRNTPLQDNGSSQCIYDAQQARAIRTIYIEYDHLGIRGIYFDVPNSETPSSRDCCGVWWTEVARESGLLRITTKSDGMKLRRLVDSTDSMAASFPRLPGHGLMFRTNQDRKVLFGPYIVHPKFRNQYHLIYSTTNSPSRIYFNEWDPFEDEKCVKYIGIESDAAETDRATNQRLETSESMCPPPLTTTSQPPYTQYNEPWHYTNCMLENVVEIACCVDGTVSHKPVIGMMVHYGDGHRACIGQYRLDWVLDKSPADPSMSLRIGLAKTRKNFPYVARITLGNPAAPASDSLSWMDVPWHGKLEWWFSQRQCRLCHCD
ncbi:uncharacterized protein HRG_08791 [Hirsutella rhossiliensis]|uniref:Uncharacterized protein n=1 Tax=Hirsutella rhossiliensis TaxID=111463 RepID=A0A9P8MR56_9HYPO|nr:uncharacterized protein HRG_08791 [Hirsutella rhossiliensis]KAH0959770.1 hypothetical protein HRG_08791 [Hirsutella rhossiliensis]